MSENPKDKSAASPRLRRFIQIVGAVLILLVIALAAITLPDQFGSAPESLRPFAELIPERPAPPAESVAGSRAEPIQTSATTLTNQDALTSFSQRFHPIPDVSALPLEFQDRAREWNAQMDELTLSLFVFYNKMDELPYLEALKELQKIHERFYGVYCNFGLTYASEEKFRRFVMENPDLLFSEDPMITSFSRHTFRILNLDQWYETYHLVQLALLEKHEKWDFAAEKCLIKGFYEDGNPKEWRREAYFWRKMGLEGRYLLAARSVLRKYPSLRHLPLRKVTNLPLIIINERPGGRHPMYNLPTHKVANDPTRQAPKVPIESDYAEEDEYYESVEFY